MDNTDVVIQQIEIYKYAIRLKEPFVISLGPFTHARNILIVIRTNAGITGFGECSPFLTIHGESQQTCYTVAHYLAKVLIGKDPLDIEACAKAMDTVIYGNSSIKSAFDMALYDIASQHAGLPLYVFLGGSNTKKLVTDFTVSIGEPAKMAAKAREIQANGFQVIKVKLGGTVETDVERIKLIREAIGEQMPLRIDANQGWSADDAIRVLYKLAPYNIQHCEEPIPRCDFMELARVRKNSPIPIMADESCCDHHDAKRLIALSACDSFNVKLGKSSGIFKALKILALAEQACMKVQVGGFLESRLGFTASAHLALASDSIVHCDFDTPLMFINDPVNGGIRYDDNGVITMHDGIGLGATIDEKYLGKLKRAVVL